MRITRPKLRAMVACLAGAGLLAAGASATEPIGDPFRVSVQGPDGNAAFDATQAHIAHNSDDNEYLVVWQGVTGTPGEFEIYGRLQAADGSPIGAPFRISNMGADGNSAIDATNAVATYNTTTKEYLVAWQADDTTAPLVDNEIEIYAQRLNSDGASVGSRIRVSNAGTDGNAAIDAGLPALTYNPAGNEYLVVWHADSDVAPMVDNEFEIFAQRLSADGAEIGADTRISDMGPNGNTSYGAFDPAVVHNATDNAYLVTWEGTDDSAGLAVGETEIYAQRLTGTAAEIGTDTRVSDMGPDNDATYDAVNPDVTHNATGNEYLVTWQGDDNSGALIDNENEIYVQRVGADGSEIGSDTRISDMGPDGTILFQANSPRVAYNGAANEFLVTWHADDDSGALVDNKFEIYAQRLSSSAGEIGPNDLRISQSGADDKANLDSTAPSIGYSPTSNEYLIAWHADTDVAPLVDNEFEIYARRIKGGAAPGEPPPGTPPGGGIPGTDGAPSAANCAEVSTVTGGGASGQLSLSATQLRINQKIGQAAVRRANAIQDWLDAGIVNGDLCGGSLVDDQLDPGVTVASGLLGPVPSKADPRPLAIPPAQSKAGVTFELTTAQLKINQNVYSAAVRRANALKARIEGELTGGDITDGQLTADRLRQDLSITGTAPAAQVAAASTTKVAPAQAKNATFTLSLKQLRINQRVAQAAVKRTNELRALLGSGLKGENFADDSISAADFAP